MEQVSGDKVSEKEKAYKKTRNRLRKETRKLARLEQRNIASVCKGNPKKFWKYVRSKTKVRNDIGHLKITDESGKVNFVSDDKVK